MQRLLSVSLPFLSEARQVIVSRRADLALVVILFVALGMRLWGIGFGLPHTYHVDEGAIVMPALRIIQTGDFNPHRFDYGSVHIYLLAAVYAVYFLIGARAGVFRTVQDIPVYSDYHAISTYPFPTVFLVGRVLSAALGALTVYWVYRLATRIWGQRTGLVAAILLSVLPEYVRHAHFIIGDVPMNFLLLIALELILIAYENGGQTRFLLAGLVAGLAASTKQSAIQLAPAILLAAVGLRLPVGKKMWLSLAGVTAVGLGYLIGTPYALLDLPTFLDWQAYDLRLYAGVGLGPIYEGPSWQWHLRYLLSAENALPIMAAVLGAVLTLKRKLWLGIILIFFPIMHWVSMNAQAVRYARTWLPIAPFVSMFAAVAMTSLVDWMSWRNRRIRRLETLVMAAVLATIALPLFVQSVQINLGLSAPDVRTKALEWIEQNLPEGSRLAVDLFGPPVEVARWPLTRTISLAQHDLTWYDSEGVDYLVLSEAMALNPNRTILEEQRFQMIRDVCPPLVALSGPVLGPPESHIWIYELSSCAVAK